MPSQKQIEFIAEIIGRIASSDSPGEVEASLRGAYARMKRDGVSLEDVLTLDTQKLYQNGLSQLAEFIVKQRDDLSEPSKRGLYSEYLRLIVERFTPSGRAGQGSTSSGRDSRQENSHTSSSSQGRASTTERRPGSGFSFSPAAFFSSAGLKAFGQGFLTELGGIFGAGGFLARCMRSPRRGFTLLCASALFGLAGGLVLILLAAILHSLIGIGGPWLDFKLSSVWAFFGSACGLWKVRDLYLRGWI